MSQSPKNVRLHSFHSSSLVTRNQSQLVLSNAKVCSFLVMVIATITWIRKMIFIGLVLYLYGFVPSIQFARTSKTQVAVSQFLVTASQTPSTTKVTTKITRTSNSPMILRVRLLDGSIQKVVIPNDAVATMTLHDVVVQSILLRRSQQQQKQQQQQQQQQQSKTIYKQGILDEDFNTDEQYDSIQVVPLSSASPASTFATTSTARTQTNTVEDPTATLAELGLKHGSLITLIRHNPSTTEANTDTPNPSLNSNTHKSQRDKRRRRHLSRTFVPFPELAKDYEGALLKAKIRRGRTGSSSFQDMSDVTSSLHVVEPQSSGSVKRIYMCSHSAERFFRRAAAPTHATVGLLLGTIHRERVDLHKQRPRTSLSSTTAAEEYCTVARVHAVYEPPLSLSSLASSSTSQTSSSSHGTGKAGSHQPSHSSHSMPLQAIMASTFNSMSQSSHTSSSPVLRVASWLGLQPVGWIFAYTVNSESTTDGKKNNHAYNETDHGSSLPVLAEDIIIGAQLQIENMKEQQQNQKQRDSEKDHTRDSDDYDDGTRFCTLAMDSATGATEAFQLSDVTIQMVAEGVFDCEQQQPQRRQRFVTTRYPVIVDGKETHTLDTVLCLINIALLSHSFGMYSGGTILQPTSGTTSFPVKRKNGSLTISTKKMLCKELKRILVSSPNSLEQKQQEPKTNSDVSSFLDLFCDFHILVALDSILTMEDSQKLCQIIRTYATRRYDNRRRYPRSSTTILPNPEIFHKIWNQLES